jgi:glycine C-acetyltransferase
MDHGAAEAYAEALEAIRAAGLEKGERPIFGPQGAVVRVGASSDAVLNFCANNYLGLSSHPRVL